MSNKFSRTSTYTDYVWDEVTEKLLNAGINPNFTKWRRKFTINPTRPYAIMYHSIFSKAIIIVTNISIEDPVIHHYVVSACDLYIDYIERIIRLKQDDGRVSQTFALELLCDEVKKIKKYYEQS